MDEESNNPGNRACPWCAETIKSAAIICRYCGRDVKPQAFENSSDALVIGSPGEVPSVEASTVHAEDTSKGLPAPTPSSLAPFIDSQTNSDQASLVAPRRSRRSVLTLVAVAILLVGGLATGVALVSTSSAKADYWSTPHRLVVDNEGFGNGSVSCPTTSFCLAAFSNGDVINYYEGSWQSEKSLDPGTQGMLVSCPSTLACVLMDEFGDPFTYGIKSKSLLSVPSVIINGSSGVNGLSCASLSFCMAVTTAGTAFDYSKGRSDLGVVPYGVVLHGR
jgi:hypothetical protein